MHSTQSASLINITLYYSILVGVGQFHLKPAYQIIKVPMEELVFDKTLNPEEIVQQIKSRTTVLPSSSSSTVSVSQDDLQSETATNQQSQEVPSILARARNVIENNKISFNAQMHIFNVEGTQGDVRVVKLHPKETCSCPANGTCYHIMAAKLSLGIKEIPTTKENRNFTKLYKSAKGKKASVKSGRKRVRMADEEPCIGDEEVCTNNDIQFSK